MRTFVNDTGIELIRAIHEVTLSMLGEKDDVDFVNTQLDKRQKLMDAFDSLSVEGVPVFVSLDDQKTANLLVKEVIKMDEKIFELLTDTRNEVKGKLTTSQNSQTVLNYTNKALSSSGSYMDRRN